MKKFFLFSLLAVAVTAQLFAQTIPNSGFETWAGGNPQGWFTTNAISSGAGAGNNVVKDSDDVHTGTYAVKISTVASVSPIAGVPIAGAAVSGAAIQNGLTSVVPAGGFPYTTRAQVFTGFYECTPASGDSCLLQAWLFQRNPSTHNRDTIAWVTYKDGNTVSTYKQFTGTFTYHAGVIGNETPDSALVLLCSSHILSLSGPKTGSTLLIDDISFSGNIATGVKNIKNNNTAISIYPNPAANEVTFKTNLADIAKINVYDILGKKVKTINVSNAIITFPVNDLNNGLYFYQLMNSREEILTTGRFSVKN